MQALMKDSIFSLWIYSFSEIFCFYSPPNQNVTTNYLIIAIFVVYLCFLDFINSSTFDSANAKSTYSYAVSNISTSLCLSAHPKQLSIKTKNMEISPRNVLY